MRLKHFLNEMKVQKNEIKQILNDESIYIGIEFEFYVDKLQNFGGLDWDMDELHRQWENFLQQLQDWAKRVEEDRDELSDEEDDLENEKEKLSNEYYETEDEKEKIDQRIDEIDQRLEEIEDEMIEVFDWNMPPEAPIDLKEYALELHGVDLSNIDYIEYFENQMEWELRLRQLEPHEDMAQVDEDDYLDEALEIMEDNFDWEFKINDSPVKGDNHWSIEVDSTVPPIKGGIEIISPPFPIPEALEHAEEMIDFIRVDGSTDNRCGLHVHMSIEGVKLWEDLDPVKLFLFYDEDYILNSFKNRKGSRQAISVKNKINSLDFNLKDLDNIVDVGKLEKELSTSKYYGINLGNLEKGHMEFRYMGGSDYENKWNEIKTNIGVYGYNLKIACDKDFKRKEYIKKLNKVINKWLERHKDRYLEIVSLQFIKDSLERKFKERGDINNYTKEIDKQLNKLLKFIKSDFKSAVKIFKSFDYGKKDLDEIVEYIEEVYMPKWDDEINKFVKNLIDDRNKFKRRLRVKYASK